MESILPFASGPHPVWSPMANDIHAAIWDGVGLGKVQGFVREWASDWVARVNAAEAKRQEKFAFARQALHYPDDRTLNLIADNLPDDWQLKEALWEPVPPELPLPPSHRPRSPAEKWAALSAVHDVFDLTGDKVLPWPLPEDDQDLAEWMRGEGGSYLSLMRAARALTDTEADPVGRWLEDVKPGAHDRSGIASEFVFAPDGDGYYIAGFGEHGHVRKLKGFDQIARLIRTPSVPVWMVELAGGALDPRIVGDAHSRQPVADDEMLQTLRQRRATAMADLEKANAENNTVDAEHCRQEIETVNGQLKQLTGIGGKARDLNNPADKLRPSIYSALERAYAALRNSQPPMTELADHFEAAICSEGAAFVYRPAGTIPAWAFGVPARM